MILQNICISNPFMFEYLNAICKSGSCVLFYLFTNSYCRVGNMRSIKIDKAIGVVGLSVDKKVARKVDKAYNFLR